jgi:lipoprotein-releasing system ATP-binding protein
MTPLIEAREVSKVLSGVVPVTLVQDITLRIMSREFVAITGPSGSGKSSLLYLLGLLDLPTSGDVLIDGRSTTAMTEEERAEVRLVRIGFVFQFHFLLPEFTITENVALPMRALANDPPVILADEPTGSLDTQATSQVFDILRDLVMLHGKTVVAVTHDLALAAKMQRRIHVVDGRLAADAMA